MNRTMKREEGKDGTRREGRFVNAEISRAAPRREPSADSQSRCERARNTTDVLPSMFERVLKTYTRIVLASVTVYWSFSLII